MSPTYKGAPAEWNIMYLIVELIHRRKIKINLVSVKLRKDPSNRELS